MAGKSILIVDDSPEMVRMVAEYLNMHGYLVHTALDGDEALSCLGTRDVEVVVSDIHMPRIDGFTLMEEIRTRYPNVPVILVTGYSVREAERIALERGANAFMAKPFRLRDLKSVIDRVSSEADPYPAGRR
ncbi:MAG TPA: response regulator [Deltaproteobacteria bacterium]|nr:response regulator [Deltaproteobacteria bacterium]HPP79938.1 response regulator [Deltaproteobacteria bacterium]